MHPHTLHARAAAWALQHALVALEAAAALNVPILPSSALIGFGIGTLLVGVIQLRRNAHRYTRRNP